MPKSIISMQITITNITSDDAHKRTSHIYICENRIDMHC